MYSFDLVLFPIWNQSIVPCLILTVAPLDLHTDFSGGRPDGPVFLTLEKLSTVC